MKADLALLSRLVIFSLRPARIIRQRGLLGLCKSRPRLRQERSLAARVPEQRKLLASEPRLKILTAEVERAGGGKKWILFIIDSHSFALRERVR